MDDIWKLSYCIRNHIEANYTVQQWEELASVAMKPLPILSKTLAGFC